MPAYDTKPSTITSKKVQDSGENSGIKTDAGRFAQGSSQQYHHHHTQISSTQMPAHAKPSIINSRKIPIITDSGEDSGISTDGDFASIPVNPQTIVTLFGVVTATWQQKVRVVQLDKETLNQIGPTLFLDGDTTDKTITLGPLDANTIVEVTFYHKKNDDDGWQVSTIEKKKVMNFTDDALESAISLIPVDDGGHGDQDYQNTTLNVSRMTLF